MEGFSTNRGYNDGNLPFMHSSYFPYAGEPYGYYQFPYSYPYEHIPSDPPWPPSPMYAPNPYMIPHSFCMDMRYIPPLDLRTYPTMTPERGKSSSKTRSTRRSRGGRQPCSKAQVLPPMLKGRGCPNQIPPLQNGYMMRGFHDWSETVHPSFCAKTLNPYAYPLYPWNNECLPADFSEGNLNRDILSEAMKESGIGDVGNSSELPVENKADKSRNATNDGQVFRNLCAPNNTHPVDLTLGSCSSRENGCSSNLYFPEPQHLVNRNCPLEEYKSFSGYTLSTQNDSFSDGLPSSTEAQHEAQIQSTGQGSEYMDNLKQIDFGSSTPSSELQNSCTETAEKEEKQFWSILPAANSTDYRSDVLSILVDQNPTTISKSDFPPAADCSNIDSSFEILSPLNTCKSSLDMLDLSDLPSLEDLALDFNGDSCANDINIESLINSVNELCQLEGGNKIGSYYLTDTDGQIILELHEEKDNRQNTVTTESQGFTDNEEKYINGSLLYGKQDANSNNGKLMELSDDTFSVQCINQTNVVTPKAELLQMPDVDVHGKAEDDDTGSGCTDTEGITSNSLKVENDSGLSSSDKQSEKHSKDVTKQCQLEHEFHLIAFDPDNNVGQVPEPIEASSSAVSENLMEEPLDGTQQTREFGRKTKNLRNNEISKHDKGKHRISKTEKKKKYECKQKKKLNPAAKEYTRKYKTRLKRESSDVSKNSSRIELNEFSQKEDSPSSTRDSASLPCLKAFIRNFDDSDEEVTNLTAAVKPNDVWNPVSTKSQNSVRLGEDIFHVSAVEMASLFDATISTLQSAPESFLQTKSDMSNEEDVQVIEDVASVQIFPGQQTNNKNLLTLSIRPEDFEKIILDEDENVLENACKLSRSCYEKRGHRNSEEEHWNFLTW